MPTVHEEVGRLPEKYRAPLVLCDLEGLTHHQADRQLGWPLGTVQSRLARGRARLMDRLAHRGLGQPAGLLAAWDAARAAPAAVPAALSCATISSAGRSLAAGEVPAAVISLARGALRAKRIERLKLAASAALVASVGLLALPGLRAAPPAPPAASTTTAAAATDPPRRPGRPRPRPVPSPGRSG